jgi:hypothetical protein
MSALHELPDSPFFLTRAQEACYTTPHPPGFAQLMDQAEEQMLANRDPEPRYSFAVIYNWCLGNAFTAKVMKTAIEGGYCSYDYLQMDPMLAEFRKSAEYPAIAAEAKRCKDRFLVERDRPRLPLSRGE